MIWAQISVRTATVVLSNAIAVCVAVPADNEATRICLPPAALFLSLSRMGSFCRTCQASELFVVGSEIFYFLLDCCIGGDERGNGSREFMEHRLFVGGGVGKVIEIVLEFLVFDGFSK